MIVLFHAFKHHFGANIEWLIQNRGEWEVETDRLLKSLGASLLDYYIGRLAVNQIETEICNILNNGKIVEKDVFENWIAENGGFREVQLSDGSDWTLRYLDRPDYVHVHPSRYSKYTIRIKANTLKTVLCTLLLDDIEDFEFKSVTINMYRADYLDLSYIKLNGNHDELKRIFNLFINEIKNNEQ